MFSQNVTRAYTEYIHILFHSSHIYMNMGTHTQNVERHKGTKNKVKM